MEDRPRQTQPRYDDEIGLVDLATTFLRRRRVFYGVFLAVLLAGTAYAVFIPEKYDYVSLVKLAQKGESSYAENPASIIAILENRWVSEYQSVYHAQHGRNLPFEVTFENPESTGLVRIMSEASPSNKSDVEQLHTQLIDQLKQTQASTVSRLRQNMEKQIDSLSSTVDILEGREDSGAAIAAAIEKRLSLEAILESLQPMQVLAVSRQSPERQGPARSLIVMLAGLLGLMGGVFLAFFAEFAGAVKNQMSEM
ncbi:lipopolysaccharide biosynthesis protein [Marinobacter salinus]|uniref:Lipopolysaccharide biosynthesis protein n=1 Tax=Marinobacter salinus TaxID=1874317 RepID=A0A1D9GHW9_9GAMM|nr:Wzz/FepE/Etk N-terminal domain-containing protein [Marinobacter salinus]AOY87124.1 lipopolysaccharide biosynthesis protein [Marinobacter salinus]